MVFSYCFLPFFSVVFPLESRQLKSSLVLPRYSSHKYQQYYSTAAYKILYPTTYNGYVSCICDTIKLCHKEPTEENSVCTYKCMLFITKSLIQHCERSELRLHFEWTKVALKCQKSSIMGCFWKPEACNSVTIQVSFNRTRIGGKFQDPKNSNLTFGVICHQHLINQ